MFPITLNQTLTQTLNKLDNVANRELNQEPHQHLIFRNATFENQEIQNYCQNDINNLNQVMPNIMISYGLDLTRFSILGIVKPALAARIGDLSIEEFLSQNLKAHLLKASEFQTVVHLLVIRF